MAVNSWDPFPQEALAANRAGQLSDAQQRNVRDVSKSVRKTALGNVGVVVIATAISVVGVVGRLGRANPAPAALLAAAVVAFAAFVIIRTLANSAAIARDLRHVQVQSIEGAIGKRLGPNPGGSWSRPHFLEVGQQTFRVGRATYDAAPDAGFVRVYFLPHSRRVVNLERLPDRFLSSDTSPQNITGSLLAAVRSGDQSRINEFRASMAAFGPHPTSPPQDDRDPRPLRESILGTWSSGIMTVAFSPDGTVTAMMPGGKQRRGRWSVDGSGRLRADVTGAAEAADAWVAGDQLTISVEGKGLTFRRERSA